ncbi:MAG TPA: formylglycine-generating enzyme family protein [Blastocatellia bacterium]|nr:formylglycine-generating enzyme family protein [Blastocatellia bacterium]
MLEMVAIPGGVFMMGSPSSETGRLGREGPQYQVIVPDFFMGKYQITQAQWQAVAALPKVTADLDPDPSSGFRGKNLPIEVVSWHKAVEFCARLSKKSGKNFRLPSEAEWEYVCRAGTTTPFAFGETITPEIANYNGQKTVDVGSLGVANAFGLYDLHGNVWEWCQDVRHDNYIGAPTDGSAWISEGNQSYRMLRGGSWHLFGFSRDCRSAFRNYDAPGVRSNDIGFRVVMSVKTCL